MADLVLFGAGQAAESVTAYLERHTPHRIVAYTVDAAFCRSDTVFGKPLVPWERLPEVYPPDRVRLFGPFSYQRLNQWRRDRFLEARALGYGHISFIHPSCQIYTEDIGDNCLLLPQTVIETRARIGHNVVIWGQSWIAHHCVVGDHCFFSSHVTVSGGVHIGEMNFFGAQANIGKGVEIGNGCFFGEGAQILRQKVPDHSAFVTPATERARYTSTRLARYL